MPESATFFGETGSFQSVLKEEWVDFFGGPVPQPLERTDWPRWLAYQDPSEEQQQEAVVALGRAHGVIREGAGLRVIRSGESFGSFWLLIVQAEKPYVIAWYHGAAPGGMSDDQMADELERLAWHAQAGR